MVTQYDIYFARLDPTEGAEINKTRPCVVVSPKEMNDYLRTIIIVPITSTLRTYATRIGIELLGRQGQIAIDQIRTIDKTRLINKVGELSESQIREVKIIIQEMLVD